MIHKSQVFSEAIEALKDPSTPEWKRRKSLSVLILGDIEALGKEYNADAREVVIAVLQAVGVWLGASGFGPSENEDMAILLDSAKEIIADTLDDYLSVGDNSGLERKFASMVKDKDSKLH